MLVRFRPLVVYGTESPSAISAILIAALHQLTLTLPNQFLVTPALPRPHLLLVSAST